jgi:DNA-binding transcriptional regulator YhcF (GntR family)
MIAKLWKTAVFEALQRYVIRNNTVQIARSLLIEQELGTIVAVTQSAGKTPEQTISRVLQELRDEGVLFFSESAGGSYVFNSQKIEASKEDFPSDVLINAIKQDNLDFTDVVVSDEIAQTRIRRGVKALRQATLQNYGDCCALCDIASSDLLVTSHVARWADNVQARGNLSNTICLCQLHDALFEKGYFGLTDDFQVIRRPNIDSQSIQCWLEVATTGFKPPQRLPSPTYLAEHRQRHLLLY